MEMLCSRSLQTGDGPGKAHMEKYVRRIDHVLTNRRWGLFDVSVLPSFDIGSDHRLVRAKLTLKKKMNVTHW
ncbi:unnamed protein product [Heligmosomoides polygyrus]|uniref:Endo/exonuclease/phosphatase domain-containing protein n=1 Tax=Heligmosomoides polygyrus TaxID=6339 RepID=A0A183GE18_HELPZ|nr:unnamed protein product [Heligmosomoides polygyrus]